MTTILTKKEQLNESIFWQKQIKKLETQGVNKKILECMRWFTPLESFGYETGQLRPGNLGKWDMYYFLIDYRDCSRAEAANACDLSIQEINKAEREDELSQHGIDASNPIEVAMYEHMEGLSPDELDEMIIAMEDSLLN